MLAPVGELNYVIVICDDIEHMKSFYRELFSFPVASETATGLTFNAGRVLLSLRKRERDYDGAGGGGESGGGSKSPGVQLAFLVSPAEVDQCYQELVARGVEILEPVTDQPRGHRTVYFSDPEGNILEVYAEI